MKAMKKDTLGNLFGVGINFKCIEYFSEIDGEININNPSKFHNNEISLLRVLTHLEEFINNYQVSQRISYQIKQYINIIKDRNYPGYAVLNAEDKLALQEMYSSWYETIYENCVKVSVFVPDNDHNLNPRKLIMGVKSFFDEELWNKLQPITKRDLEEAIKCIYYKLPTPAGILILRATEAELRKYYEMKIGKLTKPMNWGSIIRDLKKLDSNNKLHDHLDYLRANFRNKLSHPDSVLEQFEVESIFPMIVSTLNELKK